VIAAPGRTQLANLKLFEYLAAGRPILALAGGTEAGRIVSETGGEVVRSDDVSAIADALARLVSGPSAPPDEASLREYSYPSVAERMAAAVERAAVKSLI
jgi:glycosyltransferase involved in cell wall biosynthesis